MAERILVVDDDPDILDVLRLVLEGNGFEVETARSGEEGLRCYRAHAPDALLVDLMMEEVDAGTVLVRELQRLGNRAPVFLLSSAGDGLYLAADYGELGLAGVLQKPIDGDVLVSTLRARLDAGTR